MGSPTFLLRCHPEGDFLLIAIRIEGYDVSPVMLLVVVKEILVIGVVFDGFSPVSTVINFLEEIIDHLVEVLGKFLQAIPLHNKSGFMDICHVSNIEILFTVFFIASPILCDEPFVIEMSFDGGIPDFVPIEPWRFLYVNASIRSNEFYHDEFIYLGF
jgi:hypothetical protein